MRVHESPWGCIFLGIHLSPGIHVSSGIYVSPGYMYPQGYMYPHRPLCTLITVHHSASQCIRLHQPPKDGDRWKTLKVDLQRYRGQFQGGLREWIANVWVSSKKKIGNKLFLGRDPKIQDLLVETSLELPSIPPKSGSEGFPTMSKFWDWMRVDENESE